MQVSDFGTIFARLLVCILGVSSLAHSFGAEQETESAQQIYPKLIVVGNESNDLFQQIRDRAVRFDNLDQALEHVRHGEHHGAGLLVLADGYPDKTTDITEAQWVEISKNDLKAFVEYPAFVPGVTLGTVQGVRWERAVVSGKGLGLQPLSILSMQDCRYLPMAEPLSYANNETDDFPKAVVVVGRVAGFNHALFGPPNPSHAILVQRSEHVWFSTTKLSAFLTARYAPHDAWATLMENLLQRIQPSSQSYLRNVQPAVRPYYSSTDPLPENAIELSLERGAKWFTESQLLITPDREKQIHQMLLDGTEVVALPLPPTNAHSTQGHITTTFVDGLGGLGILEGYASQILPDGSQLQRTPLRADCQAESAAALAMNAAVNGDKRSAEVASNLLDYLYFKSDMQQKERGDPKHPAFGLIAWGTISPAWYRGNYGDDNARTILATIVASSLLKSEKWDVPVLRALYANLRTTGRLGFRGDRVDIPHLEAEGIEAISNRETLNLSPFFESYLWACYLWAYHKTGDERFRETAIKGINRVMESYPNGWRWGDNLDRTRMLLSLAWLVRVDNDPRHLHSLRTVMDDLIRDQQACGAIPEKLGNPNSGHYQAPTSNEAYGTMETPLIQENGDPVSDQLYVTSFALLALRETNAAIRDPRYMEAENKLADYIIRIQVHAPNQSYLDGTWFRAFDFAKWDYWSSSGDMGWGAWSAEAGWGPAWSMIVLGLKQKETSLWDMTSDSKIDRHTATTQAEFYP